MSWMMLRAIDLVLDYPAVKSFGDVGKRAIPYGIASLQGNFEKYVEIIKIWCNMEQCQISDVTAA